MLFSRDLHNPGTESTSPTLQAGETLYQNSCYQNDKKKKKSIGKDVEKTEPSSNAGGSVNIHRHQGK